MTPLARPRIPSVPKYFRGIVWFLAVPGWRSRPAIERQSRTFQGGKRKKDGLRAPETWNHPPPARGLLAADWSPRDFALLPRRVPPQKLTIRPLAVVRPIAAAVAPVCHRNDSGRYRPRSRCPAPRAALDPRRLR